MSYGYPTNHYVQMDFRKEFENLTVEQLEEIILTIHNTRHKDMPQYHLEKILAAFEQRRYKLNKTFVWTTENVQRIVRLDKQLIECFRKLREEALDLRDAMQKRIDAKDPFLHDYNIECVVTPFILVPDEDGELSEPEDGIYEALMYYLHDDKTILNFDVHAKSDDSIYLDFETNWNEHESLSQGELKDYYISYAIHNLAVHSIMSLPDIMQINDLWAEVKVDYQHFKSNLL